MFDTDRRYTCGDCQQHKVLGAGSIGGAIRDVNKFIHHHAKNRYVGAVAPQQVDRGLSVSAPAPQVPSMVLQKPLTKVETFQQALKQLNAQVEKMKVHIKELQKEEEFQSKSDQIMVQQAQQQAALTKNFEYQQNLLQKNMSKQMEAVQSRTLSNVTPLDVPDQADHFANSLGSIASSIASTSPRGGQHNNMYSAPTSAWPLLHSMPAETQRLVEGARRTTQAGFRTDPHLGAPILKVDSGYGLDLPYNFPGYNPPASAHRTVLAAQSSHMGSQQGTPHSSVYANPPAKSVSGFIEPYDRSGFLTDEARNYENPNGFSASKSAQSQNNKGEHIFNMTPN